MLLKGIFAAMRTSSQTQTHIKMTLAAPFCGVGSILHTNYRSAFPSAFALSFYHIPSLKLRKASVGTSKSNRTCNLCVRSSEKLSDAERLPLSDDDTHGLATLPSASGIYAIYDKLGGLQFIGLSRRLSSSIHSHVRYLPELCGSVKIAVINAPDREPLVSAWKQWMEEYIDLTGKAPPGNMSGVTTWTMRKERRAKPDLQLTPGHNQQLTITLEELIDKVVKEHKIVAFIKGSRSAPACGFSHRVLTILNEQGVDYETINVLDEEHNTGVREALKVYSSWPTFPQVYIHGELVGGADIIDQMLQNGSLKTLLQQQNKVT